MSEFTIKPYNESFIEKQVEIGTTFADRWITYGQTNVERVKEVYSGENFDPETRLYCFKGEEMVGYIGANVTEVEVEEAKIKRAQTRLPFVLPGNEGAFDLLYNQLLEVLKQKEVDEIETPQTVLNDNYYEMAEKLGFTKTRKVGDVFLCDIAKMKPFETDYEIIDYNHETDVEQIKTQLNATYPNIEGENLDAYAERMATSEELVSYRVIKEGEDIIAYCATTSGNAEATAQTSLLIGKNSELKRHLISDALIKLKENGFKQAMIFLNLELEVEKEEAEDFKAIGFEHVATYDVLTKKL
ncbi:MAG: hypothetical protein ACTSQF_12875 [Candidatus Heimdallarchaeaceae archaeon]